MRIICPTCASHYEVDESRIAAQGQLVRCARCRDVWLVRPTDAGGATVEPIRETAPRTGPDGGGSRSEVVDIRDARLRLRPRGRPAAARRDWATSFSLLAAAALALSSVLGLHAFRSTIVAEVPAAAPLYAAVGLPVHTDHLALQDVRSRIVEENNEPVLQLQGSITNRGNTPVALPNLTVVVRSDAKLPLFTYTAPAPKPQLAQGETVDFRSRLASPPAAGHDVRVSLDAPSAP